MLIFLLSHTHTLTLTCTASRLAFDQYGQISEQLEQESALRERAETLATQVHTLTPHETHTLINEKIRASCSLIHLAL